MRKGNALIIEVEVKKQTPFAVEPVLFDPDTLPKLTVTDPLGTVILDAVDLAKYGVGQYYYIHQSLGTWEVGEYVVDIDCTDTIYVGLTKSTFYIQ